MRMDLGTEEFQFCFEIVFFFFLHPLLVEDGVFDKFHSGDHADEVGLLDKADGQVIFGKDGHIAGKPGARFEEEVDLFQDHDK